MNTPYIDTIENPDTSELTVVEDSASGNPTEAVTTGVKDQFVYTPLRIYTYVSYGGILSSEVQMPELSKVTSVKYEPAVDSTVKFGCVEISVDLVETIDRTYFDDVSHYLSKDKKFIYTKFSGDDSFRISCAIDSGESLFEYPYDEITEENLIKHAREYMSSYINLDDFSHYKYCPQTVGKNVSEKEVLTHTEPSIVVTDDRSSLPYFEPNQYIISYKEFINGIETENQIMCVCDANGNIKTFEFIKRNLNWSEKVFNEKNIQVNIDKFLEKYVVSECTYDDWYIEDQKLMKVNDTTTMYVTLKVNSKFPESDYVYLLEVRLYLS